MVNWQDRLAQFEGKNINFTSFKIVHVMRMRSIHFTLKMEAAQTFETLVSYHNTTWHHIPDDLNMSRILVYKQ
jgi:hypothetical protein